MLFCFKTALDFSKIFDTMISPILTYNSEAWGVFTKSDFKKVTYNFVNVTYKLITRHLKLHALLNLVDSLKSLI